MEAVYHRVPVLGLPVSNDQFANMARAQRQGFAQELRWIELNQDSLLSKIQELITNPR